MSGPRGGRGQSGGRKSRLARLWETASGCCLAGGGTKAGPGEDGLRANCTAHRSPMREGCGLRAPPGLQIFTSSDKGWLRNHGRIETCTGEESWPSQERGGLGPAIRSCLITPHQVEKARLSAASLPAVSSSLEPGDLHSWTQSDSRGRRRHSHHCVHLARLPSGSIHLSSPASEPPPDNQPHCSPFREGTEPWAAPLPPGLWYVQDMSVQPGGSVAPARPYAGALMGRNLGRYLGAHIPSQVATAWPNGHPQQSQWQGGSSDCCWGSHLILSRARDPGRAWSGAVVGAVGGLPSPLSHDASVIGALTPGSQYLTAAWTQPRPCMGLWGGRSSPFPWLGGGRGWGARNLRRKQQWPENLENASNCLDSWEEAGRRIRRSGG